MSRLTLIGVVMLAGCSYNWTSVIPGGPTVTPHRGSPLVTITKSEQRLSMHHEPSSFWAPGGEHIVDSKIVDTSHHDLDVRTCRASLRWSAPSGPEPGGSDVPLAERGMMGRVRFYADNGKTRLMAANVTTGQTWTAAMGFADIMSVTAVPAARRVVVLTTGGAIFVYDADANSVRACGSAR